MSLLQVELYDALKSAGAPEDQARHAAIEAAGGTSLLGIIAERLNGLESKVTWMGATLLALNLLMLGGVISTLFFLARR